VTPSGLDPELTHLSFTETWKTAWKYTLHLPGVNCHYKGIAVPVSYSVGSSNFKAKGSMEATPAARETQAFEATFSLTDVFGVSVISILSLRRN
jgi:hypothetical protein